MSAAPRLRPEALFAAFAIAVFLGFGSGYFIGDLRSGGASPATTTTSTPTTSSTTLAVAVQCAFTGPAPASIRPAFVAGLREGGAEALADAFEAGERELVSRSELNAPATQDRFVEAVLSKRDRGAGVLLIQRGPAQSRIADRVAGAGVTVVVVLPADASLPPAEYPAGTLGVRTTATSSTQASLTAPEARDVVRVLTEGIPCPTVQAERNDP